MPQEEIMVVEDDEHIAHLLTFMLSRDGYEVGLAMDGQAAADLIDGKASPPALVLLDVMLPYIDGFQLLDKIRKRPGWEDIPVVMLTAKSQEKDIVRALDLGATDYMIKPFQPMELLARVRHLLAKAKGGN